MYGCETWTLRAADKNRITVFQMTAYRRMVPVSWREHGRTTKKTLGRSPKTKASVFWTLSQGGYLSTSILHRRQESTRKTKERMD